MDEYTTADPSSIDSTSAAASASGAPEDTSATASSAPQSLFGLGPVTEPSPPFAFGSSNSSPGLSAGALRPPFAFGSSSPIVSSAAGEGGVFIFGSTSAGNNTAPSPSAVAANDHVAAKDEIDAERVESERAGEEAPGGTRAGSGGVGGFHQGTAGDSVRPVRKARRAHNLPRAPQVSSDNNGPGNDGMVASDDFHNDEDDEDENDTDCDDDNSDYDDDDGVNSSDNDDEDAGDSTFDIANSMDPRMMAMLQMMMTGHNPMERVMRNPVEHGMPQELADMLGLSRGQGMHNMSAGSDNDDDDDDDEQWVTDHEESDDGSEEEEEEEERASDGDNKVPARDRSSEIRLEADSLAALENILEEHRLAQTAGAGAGADGPPPAAYNLDLTCQMNQAALELLGSSSLAQDLRGLAIRPEYGDRCPSLDWAASTIHFPQLRDLSMHCQSICALHFTEANTPQLEGLSVEQPQQNLEYVRLQLPRLEHLHLEFLTIQDPDGFGLSLSQCPKLEQYSGYKVWGLGVGKASHAHWLVLPKCTSLDFYRSDDLDYLNIWAPRLTNLNLQAAYGIRRVNLADAPPPGFNPPLYATPKRTGKYTLNLINTDFPRGNIASHRRCRKVFSPDDDPEEALMAGYM